MREFKPTIFFLLRLFTVYIVLVTAYNIYLKHYNNNKLTDLYTKQVATVTTTVMNWIEPNSTQTYNANKQFAVYIRYKEKYISFVNEGCNAISVMIIFLAITAGFYTKPKPTLLFAFGGLGLIAIVNILRIIALNYIFYYYPQYNQIAHDYLFPAIIYGTIVILWLLWIQFFVFKKE